MIRNYIKIALRNVFKDRFYSLLNIVGLSIGITTSLLIMLYIVDELSYDEFHNNADDIYRVSTIGKMGDQQLMNVAVTGAPLAEAMRNSIPEVRSVTRLQPRTMIFENDQENIKEKNVYYADSTFFDVFSFPILSGEKENMLSDPYSVVLTRETAIRYFGRSAFEEGKITGKLMNTANDTYKITGIVDNVPDNSHFDFDLLVSMATNEDANNPIWINMNYYTYIKLREGTDPATLKGKMRDLVRQYVIPQVIAYLNFPEMEYSDEDLDQNFRYILQPITDIHLHSNLHGELQANSSIQYIYIFSAIAIFIILIACINFMNLATARSAKRAKEVGIRKTLGSSRNLLMGQFMLESFLFILIAMLIALGLTEAFRTPFNTISGKSLTFNVFQQTWILGLIIGIILIVTFIAGSYPALYLTKFKPVDVLKGTLHSGHKGSWFRSSLVIFQFIISISLIVCTILVYKQMNYIQNKNLGFRKENVIILENGYMLREKTQPIKREIMALENVISAGYTTHVPSEMYWSSAHKAEGDLESDHVVFLSLVDYDFKETLNFHMRHGRFFSRDYPSDSAGVVLNESAAEIFGWGENDGEEAIGKRIEMINTQGGNRSKFEVIGIVENFNFETLKNDIRPMAMYLRNNGPQLAIRVKSGKIKESLSEIEAVWSKQAPEVPFDYEFLDEKFGAMYEKEKQLSSIFTIFTVFAIFVACLGLFGLAAYTSEQRTKEIGIRKAMGASSLQIVNMLNLEFTRLVILAFIISVPLAWYFMNRWMESFAFKTTFGVWPFIAAGISALMIAWITVSYQSVRAAKSNPVESLRNE